MSQSIYVRKTLAFKIARKFFELAPVAAYHGGFWVSAGGGTANVVAGEISRACNIPFEMAHQVLDIAAKAVDTRNHWEVRLDWYAWLDWLQPTNEWSFEEGDEPRFDARTIVRAAIRFTP